MNSLRQIISGYVVTLLLLAMAAAFWFAQVDCVARPAVEAAVAPAEEFSAVRADAVLGRILGSERPHPVSTPENAAVRARILNELAAIGVPASIHSGFACNGARSIGLLSCGTVNDILGQVVAGKGKAIVLMAHYDSVPAGPGAADDESSVATIIEAARALRTQPAAFRHPILALFTDGEEAGLLGAAAFLDDPRLRARVGAVINAEARGNRGRSLLFQTSADNGPLIDIYAQYLSLYAASSLYDEIYRFLPNDTDLTLFIRAGFPSLNFAFTEDVAQYHTALDTRANVDLSSVQQQGDNVLGMARGLEHADFTHLGSNDEIYLDLLGRVFLHIPAHWAVPLSLAAFFILLTASWLAQDRPFRTKDWIGAILVTPLLLLGAALGGWLLYTLAQSVSGMPDPSYAHPTLLRLALVFFIGALTLVAGRFAPTPAAAAACWLWMAGLGIVVACLLPGFSPYFLLPSCVAAILLSVASMLPGKWNGTAGQVALVLSAVPALLLWVGLGAQGETVMGLKLHPLVTLPVALGLTTLVPLFAAYPLPRVGGRVSMALMALVAFLFTVLAGREPAYSTGAPQRLNVTYVEEGGRARWGVDALAPVPPALRAIAKFSVRPERVSPFAWSSLYLAPAGTGRDIPPTTQILANLHSGVRRQVVLGIHGSRLTQQIFVILEKPRGLEAVDIGHRRFVTPPDWAARDRIVIACMSRDCASLQLGLTLTSNDSLNAIIGEQRFGLPPSAGVLLAARPKAAVSSQNGDGVLLIRHLRIPPA